MDLCYKKQYDARVIALAGRRQVRRPQSNHRPLARATPTHVAGMNHTYHSHLNLTSCLFFIHGSIDLVIGLLYDNRVWLGIFIKCLAFIKGKLLLDSVSQSI